MAERFSKICAPFGDATLRSATPTEITLRHSVPSRD